MPSVRTLHLLHQSLTAIPVFDKWLVRHDYRWDERHLLLKTYPELETRLAEQAIRDIERVHASLESREIELLVLLVPFREQFLKRGRLIAELHDPEKPNRLLRERLTASGVDVVDLYQVYEELGDEEIRRLYYRTDIHWTAAGVLTAHVLRLTEPGRLPRAVEGL
jgi:hypothetical protein